MAVLWSKFVENLSKCNKYQILLILIFILVSCYSVATASSHDAYLAHFSGAINPFFKHLVIMVAGILLMGAYVLFGGQGDRVLRWTGITLILATPVLIVLVGLFGKTLNGATRWISIGGLFDLQPSEVIKLALIFYMSMVVSTYLKYKQYSTSLYGLVFWCIISGLPGLVIVIIASQHSSTGIIMSAFLIIYYFIMGMPWKMYWRVLATAASLAVLGLSILMLAPRDSFSSLGRLGTMRSRIESMVEDARGEKNEFVFNDQDRQEQYSKIALANGFPFGQGPGNSKIKDVLPMANSDYIYAVLVEEFGIIALLGVPALYIAWLWIAYSLSKREDILFRRYLLYGIGLMYPMQALVHFVVVAGIIPTGQPLPFISYGGSSLMTSCLAMGIMLLIGLEQNMKVETKQVEN